MAGPITQSVTVPVELQPHLGTAVVVGPGDTLVVAIQTDRSSTSVVETMRARLLELAPQLADRVLFVAGVQALAVVQQSADGATT